MPQRQKPNTGHLIRTGAKLNADGPIKIYIIVVPNDSDVSRNQIHADKNIHALQIFSIIRQGSHLKRTRHQVPK